jgi:hypothetical protein
MKSSYIVFIVLFYSTLFNACKTDVDVIAPYKEIAVVYGLLDVSQPVQYVKINRAFLGKGDAYAMAQNPDSINYKPEDINVVLEKFNGEESKGFITLYDTIVSGGASGDFSKGNNIIYATREMLQSDLIYKLKVENKKSGYKAEATTNIINSILIPQGGTVYSFVGSDNKYTPNNTIEWTSQKNGKIYELTFRFHYKEFKNGGDTVFKYVDWAFTPQYTSTTEGGVPIKKSIRGEEFFTFLQSVKANYFSDLSVKRIAWRGQIFVTAAGEDFQIYKDLNAPYSSNFQEKPVYTNIKNGLGIFNTRVTTFGPQKAFSSNTINEVVNGKYTNDLGFMRP